MHIGNNHKMYENRDSSYFHVLLKASEVFACYNFFFIFCSIPMFHSALLSDPFSLFLILFLPLFVSYIFAVSSFYLVLSLSLIFSLTLPFSHNLSIFLPSLSSSLFQMGRDHRAGRATMRSRWEGRGGRREVQRGDQQLRRLARCSIREGGKLQ